MGEHPHRSAVGSEPPPQATMGLLSYITATSLDEDYAHSYQRKVERGKIAPRTPGRVAWGVFLAFGLLVATAGVQTARDAGASERSHADLVEQINSGKETLDAARDRLAEVQAEVFAAQRANARVAGEQAAEERRLTRLGAVAGARPVTGEGIRLVADDAAGATDDAHTVLDEDLRDIVNGLWEAGAEAVSVNGQRLTTTTAIRVAGDYITVNYEPVFPPYVVLAVGDRNSLPARFVESTSGTHWLSTQETLGLKFEMTSEESMTLPAVAPERMVLQYASTKADQVEGDS